MLIVKVMGGLGNQMQQYALYRKLLSLGKEAKLDVSWFYDEKAQANASAPRELELKRFVNLPMDIATEAEIRALSGNGSVFAKVAKKLGRSKIFEESEMYHPEIFSMDDRYLVGYFACNQYYADIMDELRRLFVFPKSQKEEVIAYNRELIREMENPEEISASIHLRRGDYLEGVNAGLLCGICTPEYYRGACCFLEEKLAEEGRPIHFYVFSDDPAFARTCSFGSRGEKITICDGNTGEDNLLDIDLMRHCRCNITANSTFSFWGARLNDNPDRVLVRPLWHRNNQTPDPARMRDYWQGFTLIDRDGKVV